MKGYNFKSSIVLHPSYQNSNVYSFMYVSRAVHAVIKKKNNSGYYTTT